MNLYLVRHGQTVGNLQGRYTGAYDDELSQYGISEIERAKRLIKNVSFDKVYSSNRKRTMDSAKILVDNEIISDCRLNERNFGIFENKTYKEICENFPIEEKAWVEDWIDYKIPDGESVKEVYERVAKFIKMLEKEDYKNCLVVTHGGIIRLIYCYVLGGSINNFWKFKPGNGNVSILRFNYDNWYIDSIIQLHMDGCNML